MGGCKACIYKIAVAILARKINRLNQAEGLKTPGVPSRGFYLIAIPAYYSSCFINILP
jgi:hypothetical protein